MGIAFLRRNRPSWRNTIARVAYIFITLKGQKKEQAVTDEQDSRVA